MGDWCEHYIKTNTCVFQDWERVGLKYKENILNKEREGNKDYSGFFNVPSSLFIYVSCMILYDDCMTIKLDS